MNDWLLFDFEYVVSVFEVYLFYCVLCVVLLFDWLLFVVLCGKVCIVVVFDVEMILFDWCIGYIIEFVVCFIWFDLYG